MSEISSNPAEGQINDELTSKPVLSPEDKELAACIDKWLKENYNFSQFLELIEAVNSNDRFRQHYGIIGIRKILSAEAPPIQPVIDANLVPRLIKFMQNDKESHLQLEAAWALTNVAAGTTQQTQTIIDLGGLATFIYLLKSPRLEIAEHAIWALGNIAGDSTTFRDIILKSGVIDPLTRLIDTVANRSIRKHGIWALSNLCRGRPLPAIALVENAIPTFCRVIQTERDVEILSDAAWALSYLSGQKRNIPFDLITSTLPALIRNMDGVHLSVAVPCLRTLGNMTEGDREQDFALSMPEYLPKLFELTTNRNKALRREACWTLSNITAGYASQVNTVMKNPYFADMLIKTASTDLPEVQREASYVLSNATKNCDFNLVSQMVEQGVLDCFIHLLTSPDVKTIIVVLEGIMNILRTGTLIAREKKCPNEFLTLLCNKKGIAKLEDLQSHPNDDIYSRAYNILVEFFDLETVVDL